MNFASLIAVAAILSLVAIPAMASMTDYQKGVNDGLMNGLRIGYLLGGAPYNTNSAQQYGSMVNSFNSWLQSEFGANQTELNLFWMKPLTSDVNPNVVPYSTSTINKPVHAIDASWNQTNRTVLGPQGQTIYGEPIEHYCTDNPNAPACDLSNTAYGAGQQPLGSA